MSTIPSSSVRSERASSLTSSASSSLSESESSLNSSQNSHSSTSHASSSSRSRSASSSSSSSSSALSSMSASSHTLSRSPSPQNALISMKAAQQEKAKVITAPPTSVMKSMPTRETTQNKRVSSHGAENETASVNSNNNSNNNTLTHIRLNPTLRFERPDNEYIPLPPMKDLQNVANALRRLTLDRDRYPEGKYRLLDYFRAAVEMFIEQVRIEFKQQFQMAQRNGRTMTRFTWKNNGELAICFACCCDMLKLLYDAVMPGPFKPLWDAFVQQLFPLLINESRVPGNILTTQTYHIKYMDWQKGGTRYGGEQTTANVRFPSVQERQSKVEAYVRSGTGYRIEATPVMASHSMSSLRAAMSSQTGRNVSSSRTNVATLAAPTGSADSHKVAEAINVFPSTTPSAITSSTLAMTSSLASGDASAHTLKSQQELPQNAILGQAYVQNSSHAQQPSITTSSNFISSNANRSSAMLSSIRPPIRAAVKGVLVPHLNVPGNLSSLTASTSTIASAASLSSPSSLLQQHQQQVLVAPPVLPPEMAHIYWLSALAHIKGGETHEAYPNHRVQYLPAFMRLCEAVETAEQMRIVMDVIGASTEGVQIVFEKLGGIVGIRRFVSQLITMREAFTLMYVIDKLARFSLTSWGAASQQAWKTNLNQRLTGDLNWLRTCNLIPEDKRAIWNTVLVLLEQRYIFCEQQAEGGISSTERKRQRHLTTKLNATTAAVDAILCNCAADVCDVQKWKLPRINTFAAKRMPIEVCPLMTDDTHDVENKKFLERKKQVLQEVQQEWESNIRSELQTCDVNVSAITIPVWYDPYHLLGMSVPTA